MREELKNRKSQRFMNKGRVFIKSFNEGKHICCWYFVKRIKRI